MESSTRIHRLRMALNTLQADPATPWYLVEMVYQLIDLVNDIDDLGEKQDNFDNTLVVQQKAINGLRDQYSEVLYKLKSGE